ncbi:MAG: hypothetical protein AAGB05_13470 [Pseudomonadota bacterium]
MNLTSRVLAAALVSVGIMLPSAPHALELHLRDSFSFPRAASLEWDPIVCGLWVAIEGPQLFLLTPGGREIRRIEPGMRSIRAVTVEEDGLLIADGWGGFQRITRDGASRGAPFELAPTLHDVEGVHQEPEGTFLVVEDDSARLMRIAPDGRVLMEIPGTAFEPAINEPQGIARDPITGNILMVDDNEGLNALIEVTPEGELLSITPLSQWGVDAEAVAIHAQTGTLYIGFDTGQRIAVFDYLPTRPANGFGAFEQGPDCGFS